MGEFFWPLLSSVGRSFLIVRPIFLFCVVLSYRYRGCCYHWSVLHFKFLFLLFVGFFLLDGLRAGRHPVRYSKDLYVGGVWVVGVDVGGTQYVTLR